MKLSEQLEEFKHLLEKSFHLEKSFEGIVSDLLKYKNLFVKLAPRKAVFAKLADLIFELTNSQESDRFDKFSAVQNLLNDILISLSSPCLQEKFREYNQIDCAVKFRNDSWCQQQSLIKALSLKGNGRLKTLQQAYLLKTYQNRQVLPGIIEACGDSYSKVSELALKDMLPFFGYGGLLALKASLNLQGTKSELNKLCYLIRHFEEDDLKDLFEDIFHRGHLDLKKEILRSGKVYPWMRSYLELLMKSRSPELSKLAHAAFEKLPG